MELDYSGAKNRGYGGQWEGRNESERLQQAGNLCPHNDELPMDLLSEKVIKPQDVGRWLRVGGFTLSPETAVGDGNYYVRSVGPWLGLVRRAVLRFFFFLAVRSRSCRCEECGRQRR